MAIDVKFCWNELETRDMKAASKFYEEVLGWTSHAWDPEKPDAYILLKDGENAVAGIMDLGDPQFEGIPNHWFAYIQVEDVEATCAKVESAGGTIKRPPFDVPNVGKIAIIADSTDAVIGITQPEEPM
ncbi:MAG: VOC family protein [Rhodospirillales bacterium]|nr:VOC family protein [Rhodospirillales bacterium]